jgi:hypothetical protein
MTQRVLYFTAADIPTAGELTDIAALQALTTPGYSVGVRSGARDTTYTPNLETCDLVAGTIPTAYNAKTLYGFVDALRPVNFNIWPKTVALTVAATKQLVAAKITGVAIDALTATDVTAVTTTYASSDATKATVSAGGLITGVAAGTTTITATHTYATGKTITATSAVTVS